MGINQTLVITNNPWRIPSVQNVFDGLIEGVPTPLEQQEMIADILAERSAWKPSNNAYKLAEQLQKFVGYRIKVQLWDAMMFWSEDEGPDPFEGNCTNITIQNIDGFLQAYLELVELRVLPNHEGLHPSEYLNKNALGCYQLPVANLYQITKIAIIV